MRRGVWVLAGLAGLAALHRFRPFRVEVSGVSMQPTLQPGDWLVATRAGRRRRGSVVVVADPRTGRDLVKRIVAVAGDPSADGVLPDDRFLVAGDNTLGSTDSRAFGAVAGSAIEGVVRFRYAPRPAWIR
jgi:signal peptidase I